MYTPKQLELQRALAEEFRANYFYNSLAILCEPTNYLTNGTDCFGLSCHLERLYKEASPVSPYIPYASFATPTDEDRLIHAFMGIYFDNTLVDFLDPSHCVLIPAIGCRLTPDAECPRRHSNYWGTNVILQESIFKIIVPRKSIIVAYSSPFQIHANAEYYIYPLIKHEDRVIFLLRFSDTAISLRLPNMQFMEVEWGDNLENPGLMEIVEKIFLFT